MKQLVNTILLLTFLLVGSYSHGQILDKLGKKMEKKIEDRANRKIDNAMDKTLDKTEEEIDESVKKKPKDSSEEDDGSKMEDSEGTIKSEPSHGGLFGALGKKVEVEDQYDFDMDLYYQMTSTSEKEIMEINYIFSLPKDNVDYMMMEMVSMSENGKEQKMEENMQMIFDSNNKGMIIFMEEQKMYMTMSLDLDEFVENENESLAASEDYSIEKTGTTKNILGYTCEEYKMESTDASGDLWVTTDSRLKHFDPFTAMANMSKKGKQNAEIMDVRGAVLEMNMTMKKAEKKNDVQTINYVVTDIKEKKSTKSIVGYTNPMDFQR